MITRKQAFKLLEEYKLPKNIMEHSLAVNKVAVYLAEKLKASGEKIDVNLVDIASLLHDIAKPKEIWGNKPHGEIGYRILRDISYQVAVIVKKHTLPVILKKDGLKTWEEKIVFYADMRVINDKIGPIEDRYEYIKQRYSKMEGAEEFRRRTKPLVLKLEKEIFGKIRESPEVLEKLNEK